MEVIFRGKKYIFSAGVAFYPEKEMEVLRKQAEQGWRFERLANSGFLVFSKAEPESKAFSVDFFSGKKKELPDYLSIYEEAGWEYIWDYKKRYFYFKGGQGSLPIYSDENSYWSRMCKEWLWNFIRTLKYIPIGLLLLALAYFLRPVNIYPFIVHLLLFFGIVFLVLPLSIVINVLFSLLFYGNRKKYYNRPEKYAKQQRIMRDVAILSLLGALLGALMSYFLPI